MEDLTRGGETGSYGGVYLSIWRRWSMEIPDALAVVGKFLWFNLVFNKSIGLTVEEWVSYMVDTLCGKEFRKGF